jgi:hypothetical protein
MAKNRRSESAGVLFGPALKAMFLCIFIAGSGVGYVWQKSQLHTLGRDISDREVRLTDLVRQNKALRDQLAVMCSPEALEAKVKAFNLGMVQIPASQTVRIYESTPPPVPVAPLMAGATP